MCARQLAGPEWVDRDMTFETVLAVLDALGPGCELVLPFAGGEPLLHTDIVEIVRSCTDSGRRCELATNATLLDGRRSRALLEAGLSTVIISLDAACAATYERVRRGASYERTCSNVMTLLRTKQRLGVRTWVVIQMIALPENAGEGPALRRTWAGVRGVDAVRIKADEVHVEITRRADDPPRRRRGPCHFPWLGPALVRYDGSVFPCVHSWRGEPVGRLGEGSDTLAGIWSGEAMTAWRAAHREGRWVDVPACRACRAVEPHPWLVGASVVVPSHLTRRAIPLLEAADRLSGHRLVRV